MSPTAYSLVSSWAWYFFERRTTFFIVGWLKRRSTRTTTVLSCLSLTTTPWGVRFRISDPLLLRLLRRGLLRAGLAALRGLWLLRFRRFGFRLLRLRLSHLWL